MRNISRRALVGSSIIAAGAAVGAVLTNVVHRFGLVPPDAGGIYGLGETLAYAAHRVFGRNARAREFPRSMISARPFANEFAKPTAAFERHQAANFATWRLDVRGQVTRPVSLSLADLRAMPVRSQITALTCEEGWSYVAEWTGTPLSAILSSVGVRPTARFVVYYSSDPEWWESIDMDEAMHPQTLVTWGMNGAELPVSFGGPLRLRVPRQLGYKSVKFVNRLVVTDSLDGFGSGTGQSVANDGYAWYAGI